MTTTAPITVNDLRPGEQIRWSNSHISVTVQRADSGQTWIVTTESGGFRLDDYSRSYLLPSHAADAARHVARIFQTWGVEQAVENRRLILTTIVRDQLHRSTRPGMCDTKALTAAEAELDSLATLADLAVLDSLRFELS